jgi:hypothetical protein
VIQASGTLTTNVVIGKLDDSLLARIMHVISHFFVVLYEVSTSGRALASPAAAAGLDDFGGLRLTA